LDVILAMVDAFQRFWNFLVGYVRKRPALAPDVHQPQSPPKAKRSSEWTEERESESAAWRAKCKQASLRWQHELRERRERETERLTKLAVQRQREDMEARAARESEDGEPFYQSRRWQKLRYEAFLRYGRVCALCKRTPEVHNFVLHVDHIKPRSRYPQHQWDIENLQILCEDCNLGKGARDDTKWR